jgi:ATP-dependent exoDNAse (exonuclease V) beta subunit
LTQRFSSSVGDSRSTQIGWNCESSSSDSISSLEEPPVGEREDVVLVIAGAGSGKTNTLAHRVANLIRHGADPQRMMLLTFSRRAAQEMERRVGGVLQKALGLPARRRCPTCRGAAPSTASARACCANTRRASAWRRTSPSTTAATPRT